MEQAHVVPVGALWPAGAQRIVGAPESQRRVQIIPVAILGKRAGFVDQRQLPSFDAVRDLVRDPVAARLPVLGPVVVDLRVYDRLLVATDA